MELIHSVLFFFWRRSATHCTELSLFYMGVDVSVEREANSNATGLSFLLFCVRLSNAVV